MDHVMAWSGVLLGLAAKVLMANHRFLAVKMLFVSTAIAAVWAGCIGDWPSLFLHVVSCLLMVRTLSAWKAERRA